MNKKFFDVLMLSPAEASQGEVFHRRDYLSDRG